MNIKNLSSLELVNLMFNVVTEEKNRLEQDLLSLLDSAKSSNNEYLTWLAEAAYYELLTGKIRDKDLSEIAYKLANYDKRPTFVGEENRVYNRLTKFYKFDVANFIFKYTHYDQYMNGRYSKN